MRVLVGALVAVLVFGMTLAKAEDSVLWTPSNVRGWTIAVDKTVGNGCFIFTAFEGGTALRVGFDRRNNDAYVMLLNDGWRSIREEAEYQIIIQFDNQAPWRATAKGVRMGSSPGFVAHTDKTDFMIEFMAKRGMSVSYNNREIARLSLRGTAAATTEMLRCQDAMNGGRSTVGSDPFESAPSSSSSDPFEQ